MIEIDFERLRIAGPDARAGAADAAAFSADPRRAGRLMRLVEVHRETVHLHDGNGVASARLPARLMREIDAQDIGMAVGDWVVAARRRHGRLLGHCPRAAADPHRAARCRRPPPRGRQQRRHRAARDGPGRRLQPAPHRALPGARAASGVQPVVVLTKADVAAQTPAPLDERLAALQGRLPAQIDRLAVDATDRLRRRLRSRRTLRRGRRWSCSARRARASRP